MNPQDPSNLPPGMENTYNQQQYQQAYQQQQQQLYQQNYQNYAYMYQQPQQQVSSAVDPATAAYYAQYYATYYPNQQYAAAGTTSMGNSSYFYQTPSIPQPQTTPQTLSNVVQPPIPSEINNPKDVADDVDAQQKKKEAEEDRLPMTGNIRMMNLNEKLFQNITSCNYYKDLKDNTIKQLIQIMKTDATILEPYSRRDCNQPTKAWCLLLRFHSLRPTRKSLNKLLYGKHSTPFLKCMGLTWIRFMIQPEKMWDYLEEFADCQEKAQLNPETEITIAEFVQSLLKNPKFLGVQFPRIPKAQETPLLQKLKDYESGASSSKKTRNITRKSHGKELFHPYSKKDGKKLKDKDEKNEEKATTEEKPENSDKAEENPPENSDTLEKFAEKVTVKADPFALKHKYTNNDTDASQYKKETLKSYENTKEKIKLG